MQLPTQYSKLDWRKGEKAIVRKQYIILQQGLCYHCKSSLAEEPPQSIKSLTINWSLFPPNFQSFPIHLQHNHITDMTEGAVHMYCNAVLWQYYGK